MNGDQLSGHSIDKQLAGIDEDDAAISLHVVDVSDPHQYGCVTTDDRGLVVAFFEKSPDPVGTTINAGCYVFTRAALDHIDDDQVISLEREVFPKLLRQGVRLTSYAEDSYWIDIGTPKALLQATTDLVGGVAQSPAYPYPPGARLVDDTADVTDLDLVRGGAVVGPGARVGRRAIVEGSVVMEGAVVEPGARIVRSIVGSRARVGAGTVLRKVSIGDEAVVGRGCELPSGVRIACGVHIPDGAIRTSRR
jgi:mannose-1-phosphate guanylyltransferase